MDHPVELFRIHCAVAGCRSGDGLPYRASAVIEQAAIDALASHIVWAHVGRGDITPRELDPA